MKRSDFRKYNKNTCETKAFFELKKNTGKRKQRQEPSVRRQAPKVFLPPNDPLSVEDQRIRFQIRSRSNLI